MYVKKKTKTRLLILALVIFGIIFWRGLKATTKDTYACKYKFLYAICTSTKPDAKLPGIIDIIKAGVKF